MTSATVSIVDDTSSPIRVALVPSWFPTTDSPLFGSFVIDQAQALAGTLDDVEVHVIAPQSQRASWLSRRKPVSALATYVSGLRAPITVESGHFASRLHIHRIPTFEMSALFGIDGWAPNDVLLRRTVSRIEQRYGQVHLLHAHVSYPAGAAAVRIRGERPVVLTEHQSPFPFREFLTPRGTLMPKVQRAFDGASAVIAVSPSHAADIKRLTNVEPVVIPNVCDETLFSPRTDRQPGPFRFLFVGGLVDQKGVDILLEAIALFLSKGNHAVFSLVGTGSLEASLRAKSEELGISHVVEWRGPVSRNDLPEVFRGADAFVLPSRHESFGVVVIEALASGLPVVATRCGGPEHIVQPSDGEIVEKENPVALADALARTLHRPVDRARIREDFVRRYSRRVVASKIREVYRSVLKRSA